MNEKITQPPENKPLKIFMAKNNVSAVELAETLGFKTVNAVYPYMRGERSLSMEQLKQIETKYGSVSELMGAKKDQDETVTREMFDALKKDLDFFRNLCAKLAGMDNQAANFNKGSLKASNGKIVPLFPVQIEIEFATGQYILPLSVNDKLSKQA